MTKRVVKINQFGPNIGLKSGTGNSPGHKTPGTKWGAIDQMFHIVFPVGSTWEFRTFQNKYSHMINSVFTGHKKDFGQSMATPYHLENGPAYNGTIEILTVNE